MANESNAGADGSLPGGEKADPATVFAALAANMFDDESAGRAAVPASFASVAINAVTKGEDAASLRRGLLSNHEIGKAVGMLMPLHEMTEGQAFDRLRRHSQALNTKLAEVAHAVIEKRDQLPSNGENQLPPGT